ncbi:aldehyde dehydrogenase (NADP(+)) [Mameliella alba]|uniref:aldehyde dehydrogenase (NADP(+)) n=1 Tax=Mameliella alba TaxID=561184 RepID=UPI00142F6CE5|nr:aldehyde dehydrogenase (NADP(+)) [Mameliella alba]
MLDKSTFTPHGRHLIAGEWVSGETTFTSEPAHGPAHDYSVGTPALVDRACEAAEEAFWSYGYASRETRAAFLNAIADEIEARAEQITEIGTQETGLPEARLQGERGRTTGQLRLFASHILDGAYLDRRHDAALPDRQPLPRPDLKMVQRPIGPVAVFGASNFPLAFSTAGGDTASALAAGCPVVVKGHSAHPGTGEIVAEAIHAAITKTGVHPGTFSLIQGGKRDVGQALVQHPLIRAVGFTGSLGGGRALFDLCAQRPEPIPFFGELGSVNPMFLLPEAVKARGAAIGEGWAASLTMGAGQFCTNPGIAVVEMGEAGDAFVSAAAEALKGVTTQCMLTEGIADVDEGDTGLAQRLMPVLERKAGRLLVNGFPTGVEVADAMVHGGPYPASTNFGATSVGTLAIRRFLRPVCYQNLPDALLPEDLR